MSKKTFIKGAVVLTAAGMAAKVLGFFFRIMLSRATGSEGMGLYQLVMPVLAVCTSAGISGFEVAVSRFCSYYYSKGDRHSAAVYSVLCFTMSIIACSICTALFYYFSVPVSKYVFRNTACAPLIRIIVLSLPFSCIHAIVCSHYIAKGQTHLTAISQLCEQAVRIASVYVLIKIYNRSGEPCDAGIGLAGLVIGEIFSAVLCSEVIICHKKKYMKYLLPAENCQYKEKKLSVYIKDIRKTAFPICLNRVLFHILQSTEAALIPLMLKIHGLSESEAISAFGIVSGMAMPIILFPAALTNSVATLLLPSVSKVSDSRENVQKKGEEALIFSLSFGLICIAGYLTAGAPLGARLFNEPSLSGYIRVMSFLCPFIFINTIFKSMLHALGKTITVLGNSMLSETVNIIFIVFLVPRFGIKSYITGLLVSQILSAILCITEFRKYANRIS